MCPSKCSLKYTCTATWADWYKALLLQQRGLHVVCSQDAESMQDHAWHPCQAACRQGLLAIYFRSSWTCT